MRSQAVCGARRPGTGREALPCFLGSPHDGRDHISAFGDRWTGEATPTPTPQAAPPPAESLNPDESEYQQLSRAWEDAKDRLRAAPESARHRATLRRLELLMSILLRGKAA